MKGLFVAGTDTDVGKTVVTGTMAAALAVRGMKTGVFKPLASGAVRDKRGVLKSEDASFLMKAAGIPEKLREEVNEVCLEPALTPAVAAQVSKVAIDLPGIARRLKENMRKYDCFFVEGVGGLIAPLWKMYLVADFIRELDLPVILVSHAGLGAINHTVLTAAYAKSRNIKIEGVILNRWQPEEAGILETTNQAYIEHLTGIPVIGKIPLLDHGTVQSADQLQLAAAAEKYIDMERIRRCAGGK